MTVFVDLDGVLTDFVPASLAAHGLSLPIESVRWDFPGQVGFDGANDPRFWDRLGRDFWAGLPWTEEGPALLHALEQNFDDIVLLTSPTSTVGCLEGKGDWIKRHLPAYRRKFLIGAPKPQVAGPGKILIDDHDQNVHHWRGRAGQAVLVPRPWNEARISCLPGGRFDVPSLLRMVLLCR